MREKKAWKVRASTFARNTFNPIRNIMENMTITPNPEKEMIALSIGDPTVFGNLAAAKETKAALLEAVASEKFNGYGPSTGLESARAAVAKHLEVEGKVTLEPKDIVLCSGCSCALDLCITVLCSPGQTLLVPRPGFPLYATLAHGLGIHTRHYDLKPDQNWEVDLDSLEAAVDATTAAIVINNPSNPCGSVLPPAHLRAVLALAARHRLPIIADEIYEHFVFSGQQYRSLASLSSEVPVLACGGLTKRYLVPGWRLGWVAICDKGGIFKEEVHQGLHSLSQRIIGANMLVQGALPAILETTPPSFFSDTLAVIQANAMLSHAALDAVPGLTPVMPQGAMYMMVGVDMDKFPSFDNDLEFVEKMVCEESVFCLPGKCFDYPNYVRIVLTVPETRMREACARITAFCARYYLNPRINGHANGLLTDASVLHIEEEGKEEDEEEEEQEEEEEEEEKKGEKKVKKEVVNGSSVAEALVAEVE